MTSPRIANIEVEEEVIDNPFWQRVAPFVRHDGDGGFWRGPHVPLYPPLFDGDGKERPSDEVDTDLKRYPQRHELAQTYSWAIPDPAALAFVAALDRPIIEVGAGTGYWAWLLRQHRVDVIATDTNPPATLREINTWHATAPVRYVNVRKMRAEKAAHRHSGRVLMLCWPPYNTPMAHGALDAYKGDTVIYIGEGPGGCTGDDAFHALLDKKWKEEDNHPVVQWYGLHDHIYVYRRRSK